MTDITSISEHVTDSMGALSGSEPNAITPAAVPLANDDGESSKQKTFVKFFIGEIGSTSTEESLRAYFEQFGTVDRVVVKHSHNDKQRSFAFVTIDGDTEKIMGSQHVIDGYTVATPEFARSNCNSSATGSSSSKQTNRGGRDSSGKSSLKGSRKIFVGGLSHQTQESALRAYFEQFGRLTDVVVMHEAGGRKPRGFGFVTFAESSSVQKVLQLRFHPVDGRGVEVKLAIPREFMHDVGEQKPLGGEIYSEFNVPYGEYLPEQSDYPLHGYMPSGPYGYMPQMPLPVPPMMGCGNSSFPSNPPYNSGQQQTGQPAQGIRVLYGTEHQPPHHPPSPNSGGRRGYGSNGQASHPPNHTNRAPTSSSAPASSHGVGSNTIPHHSAPAPMYHSSVQHHMMPPHMMMPPMMPYSNSGAPQPMGPPPPGGYMVPGPTAPRYG
mmetsp:Transcript_3351/g.8036  ORF Transcript_3351/g.8036 Transcript_3351/m.8036 type:complete len:436 (-) Transcript_3351:349-1656(-)